MRSHRNRPHKQGGHKPENNGFRAVATMFTPIPFLNSPVGTDRTGSNTNRPFKRRSYRPEIDGLRAIAIVAVVLYDAQLGLRGGFVGIDIFFVISGYVLTSSLAKELKTGRLDLLKFWEGRVRRLLPALTLVILATLVADWFWFLPVDYQELAQSVFPLIFLYSNYHFWGHTNYLASVGDLKPLLHTWSLSVIAQFYLVYPILLILLNKVRRKSAMVALLFCAGLALSIFGGFHFPNAAFYFLPFRGWELGLGAILAAARPSTFPRLFNEALSTIGIALILCTIYSYNRSLIGPGRAALLPCIGTALFLYANTAQITVLGKFLSWRPLVLIGLISYSLYLWHWPILVSANYWVVQPLTLPIRIFLLAASLVLALASWKFVEIPFRKGFPGRTRVFQAAAITALGLLILSLSIQKWGGGNSGLPREALRYANARFDFNPAFSSNLSLPDAKAGRLVSFGSKRAETPLQVIVWGDGHAASILPALDDLAKEHSSRGCAATYVQTPPLLDYLPEGVYSLGHDTPAFGQAVLSFIRAHQIPNVILAAAWHAYEAGQTPRFHAALVRTISALQEAGATVWVMEDVPYFPWNVPKALARSALFKQGGTDKVSIPLSAYLRQLEYQAREFSPLAGPRVVLLSPVEYLAKGPIVPTCSDDGMALYWDEHHLTTRGASLIRPMFLPIFSR